jgi:peptidoglycan hydrolase CwlO-like protein
MNVTAILTIIVPMIVAALGSFVAYKAATRVASIQKSGEVVKVDAEAYIRAKQLYESGIEQLESQVKDLREQLITEKKLSKEIQKKVNELETTIKNLRQELADQLEQ